MAGMIARCIKGSKRACLPLPAFRVSLVTSPCGTRVECGAEIDSYQQVPRLNAREVAMQCVTYWTIYTMVS